MRRSVLCLALALGLCACGRKSERFAPLAPAEALKTFHLSEDFHVELFASEPDVVDPVEIVFAENGRAYVAEMLDYPEDPPPGKPARSRIRMLETEDGKIKRSVIFAEHLLEVSSMMPWKGGLLVTAAPDILFLKDTDGDGRADVRQVLYTGFPLVNPEGRITNLRYGIDNWIYAANNGSDGRISAPDHPERPPVLVRGADFRFHPGRGLAEPASGPAQFGMTFDDWGNRFITHNTVHLRHVVAPMEYLAHAPFLQVRAVAQDISDHGRPNVRMFPLTQAQHWRVERTKLRQQRYDEQHSGRQEFAAGYITAATGSTVYNGDVFPREYWGSVFTADVSGNLVHRDILKADGVTFSASRARENVEFLASTDPWFRPCGFSNAPDGNLYMPDIYREFIETPESIPEALKKDLNFWSGDTLGRIYRIVPNHPLKTRDLKPGLGAMEGVALAQQLTSTNGWHRFTAQRLIVERQDKSAVPALLEVAKSDYPQARLHALWTLEGLSALSPALVTGALRDRDPHIRENALRLAEPWLAQPAMQAAVLRLASDSEPRVQFQLAFTLGRAPKSPRALDALVAIAAQHSSDEWFQTAVLASAHDFPWEFLTRFRAGHGDRVPPELLGATAAIIGARQQPQEIAGLLLLAAKSEKPELALVGLRRGLKLVNAQRLRAPEAVRALEASLANQSDAVQQAAWEVAAYFDLAELAQRATATALDEKAPPAKRAVSLRALRGAGYVRASPVLLKILNGRETVELQTAALETLAIFDEPDVARALLANWQAYSPAARTTAVQALLSRRDRAPALLDAIEQGRVERSGLDAAARARLLDHPDPAVSDRARRVFRSDAGDRAKVVTAYSDVLDMKGEPSRGQKVFQDQCARCHMPRRLGGQRVGPDLSGINNKSKAELLNSILNPSYAIEDRFVNYIVTTKDGQIHDGILANETPGSITLRGGLEAGDETILRKNIAEIRASKISLMPDDLEKIGKQGLADLIAYLRGGL